MGSPMQDKFLNDVCHKCGQGTYQEPSNGQEWHLVCSECGTVFFCYDPLPHQAAFHADPHKYKLFAGG